MEQNTAQILLDGFDRSLKSVMISSITLEGLPYASYTPFITLNQDYYLIMSQIAEHYRNILTNPKISLLFIEDEKDAGHIFFRKRLSFLCEATQEEATPDITNRFKDKFGQVITQLLNMDFKIVKCKPISGIFNIGPGAAYQVDHKKEIIDRFGPDGGHRPKD